MFFNQKAKNGFQSFEKENLALKPKLAIKDAKEETQKPLKSGQDKISESGLLEEIKDQDQIKREKKISKKVQKSKYFREFQKEIKETPVERVF